MDLITIKRLIKENRLVKFYQSKEWRTLRLEALKRDNYECQECKRQGGVSLAQNVHHIKEVKQFPELALVLDNLESICIPCHNHEHKRLEKYIRKKKPKFVNEERW
ncbi:HNH endonuclease signature motif containing protein [Virgibacillus salarius]|uniref:HNH endonuclease n=1 Tax=Virgibacillus salarius TaxID=447199 RepID=UPI0024901607|nr:HNH endonuclease signature motif containing protein [Virgibacillus salarius]WBX80132.1 HNH endonuclease signature motif containing protein [Virgibacillus salarius]